MQAMRVGRAEWLRRARWGVFCHYLADRAGARTAGPMTAEAWNRRVDAFDVAALARQLARVGAPYLGFTLGQNSGFYCAPNAAYDELVGESPSRLSRRDLIADLAAELAPRGIRLLVYLPAHAPVLHRTAVERLGCTPDWDASAFGLRPGMYVSQPGVDARLTAFQTRWERIVREWAERWGTAVAGWWIDGCFCADRMYRAAEGPNFATLAAALRAGNPDAIVAFNPGVRVPVVRHSEHEDYTAGEIADALPLEPPGECVDGWVGGTSQYHVLTYLGQTWGTGAPRFEPAFAAATTRLVNAQGGALTWDVPISAQGSIPDLFLERLAAVGRAGDAAADAVGGVVAEPPVGDAADAEAGAPHVAADAVPLSGFARPVAGTRTVEPRFIRLVRATTGQTQAQFARSLDVHVRTVVGWEISDQPVRVRTTTFDRLMALAAELGLTGPVAEPRNPHEPHDA